MNHETIKNLTEDFLNKLTVEFNEVEILENDIPPTIFIKTLDSGVLIGNNGENLRALNHIIKKIIEKKFSENIQFLLDVNGYHSQKIMVLKNKALMFAGRAKTFKSNIDMPPINAYERMIVHSMFINDSEIKTESEGNGKTRRVVFKYIKKESGIMNKE
ncbi:MAG: R3H domain-containing nucleic acid-binding protein [Patescibacteria group bacterium]